MKKKLKPLISSSQNDIRNFFDASARDYKEQHGDAKRLLHYRLKVIHRLLKFQRTEVLLDVGCGTGLHLFALAPYIQKGIGIDFSSQMIEIARSNQQQETAAGNLIFQIDQAQLLETIPDESMDVVLCIGAFEHMPQKEQVLKQFKRVLKTDGRLLLLTPNGNFLWYHFFAPLFGFDTRHLSSDEFVTAEWMENVLPACELKKFRFGFWTFIPKGDMPLFWALMMTGLDWLGKIFLPSYLRSGLAVQAAKKI
jgi:ubiquinone/menaquinone biosynthesis C-methylase UbiE